MRRELSPYFPQWRQRARQLIAAQVPPGQASWGDLADQAALFAVEPVHAEPLSFKVPAAFVDTAKQVACHREGSRFDLLYRMLWRILHGEHDLMKDLADEDVRQAYLMEKAVRRDKHKMTAFVRFRKIVREGEEEYVAWYRPDHLIVEAVAPFFIERFGSMRWTILTPDTCAFWDMQEIRFGPGTDKTAAPESDALEELWKSYYASVFNPARLNVKAMVKELPVRHWATLPEAELIPRLVAEAPQREEQMRAAQKSSKEFVPESRDLNVLAGAVNKCEGCELFQHATQAVFGEGPGTARLVLVGEQPGDKEDIEGRPFVGPAGKMLDRALEEAGIDRDSVYVTNAVKHFYFEDKGKFRLHKKPRGVHVAACHDWLDAELEAIQPTLIVALGATAALSLMGKDVKITEARGKFYRHHQAEAILVTIHPSYLLRLPTQEAKDAEYKRFVDDLRLVRMRLAELSASA